MVDSSKRQASASTRGPLEVLRAFTRLGLTSFGGPIAHLGYLRSEFVERREWLDDSQFAQLLAACQFLPGPASSQLGFAIGLLRAGWLGALAAFVAFTAPSALLLFALAGTGMSAGEGVASAITHGLKLVAVAVVAHGVLQMSRKILVEGALILIAALSAAIILVIEGAVVQLGVIAAGALLGDMLCRRSPSSEGPSLTLPFGRRAAGIAAALFVVLLIPALFVGSTEPSLPGLAAAFYRAGALVFGGGHVVLPLLETSLVGTGWMSKDVFLSGYGAAQAVPGPMFSLAAYLGAEPATGVSAVMGSLVAVAAVFLPGFLLLIAVLPFWARLHGIPAAQRSIAGVGAAVVGLLGAALYDPVWTSAVAGSADVAIAIVALALLHAFNRSALLVVLWCVSASLVSWQVG